MLPFASNSTNPVTAIDTVNAYAHDTIDPSLLTGTSCLQAIKHKRTYAPARIANEDFQVTESLADSWMAKCLIGDEAHVPDVNISGETPESNLGVRQITNEAAPNI